MATNNAVNTYIVPTTANEVTMPSQPCFMAYLGTTDSNVTGDSTIYTLGSGNALTEIIDNGGDFNTNGTFTAPVTGSYLLTVKFGFNPMTAGGRTITAKIITSNRTIEINTQITAASGSEQSSIQLITDMDATDTSTYTLSVANEGADTVDMLGAADLRNVVSGCLLA